MLESDVEVEQLSQELFIAIGKTVVKISSIRLDSMLMTSESTMFAYPK